MTKDTTKELFDERQMGCPRYHQPPPCILDGICFEEKGICKRTA